MLAIKSVKQNYSPSTEVLELLDLFRRMVNRCIVNRAFEKRLVTQESMLPLIQRARELPYTILLQALCNIPSRRHPGLKKEISEERFRYKESTCRQASTDFVLQLQDSEWSSANTNRPKEIRNNSFDEPYRLSISDKTLRVRSFTLTANTLSLCISKEVVTLECVGTVGSTGTCAT